MGAKSARSEEMTPGILTDFAVNREPIGLEITVPMQVTAGQINAVLTKLGLALIAPEERALRKTA